MRDGSDIIAMLVEDRPNEMFREGYDLAGRIPNPRKSGTPSDSATDVLESDVRDMREWAEEQFGFDDMVRQGMIEGGYWGGTLLPLGVNDGGFPWEPLNEDRIQSFDFVSMVDRRYAYTQSQYSAMFGRKYGQSEIYLLSNAVAASGWSSPGTVQKKTVAQIEKRGASISFLHETRSLRFDGNIADIQTRQRLAGWSWSLIQRAYDVTRAFEHAFDSVGYMLSDASQGVMKLFGIVKAIGSGKRQQIMDRALLFDQQRSTMRSIIIDAGGQDGKGAESFERMPTPFTGIPDLLQIWMMRFSAVARIPVSRIFGKSPQGLNASGDNEMRAWYDSVRAEGNKKAAPSVKRGYTLMSLARNSPLGGKRVNWQVEWRPLWSPTDAEVATTRFQIAQADALYVENGVVPAEVVALTLKDNYPALDVKGIEDAIEAGKSFDPAPNDPDPTEQGEPLGAAPVPTMGSPNPKGAKKPGFKTPAAKKAAKPKPKS